MQNWITLRLATTQRGKGNNTISDNSEDSFFTLKTKKHFHEYLLVSNGKTECKLKKSTKRQRSFGNS